MGVGISNQMQITDFTIGKRYISNVADPQPVSYTHLDVYKRQIQKEALRWNEIEQAFERFYCLNYNYTEAGTDVEYALWDNKTNAYSDVKEKAVYLQAGDDINYLSYKWSKKVFQDPSKGTCPSMTILENLSIADNKGKTYGLGRGRCV